MASNRGASNEQGARGDRASERGLASERGSSGEGRPRECCLGACRRGARRPHLQTTIRPHVKRDVRDSHFKKSPGVCIYSFSHHHASKMLTI